MSYKQYEDLIKEDPSVVNPYDVVIREGTVAIADEAFRALNIRTVRIPDSVTYVGESAFRQCTSLTTMRMSTKLETLSNYAFGGCTALKAAYIPGTVHTIGGGAFANCSAISTIYMQEGIQGVMDNAFNGCRSVNGIYFTGAGRGTAWNNLLNSETFSETGNAVLTEVVPRFDTVDGAPCFSFPAY